MAPQPQRYAAPLGRKTRSPLAVQGFKKAAIQPTRVSRFPDTFAARKPVRIQAPDYVLREKVIPERAVPAAVERRRPQYTAEYREILDQVYDRDDQGEDVYQERRDSVLFHWEDEKTLVSDMMHVGAVEDTEDTKVSALVDSLQNSFSVYSKELIGDIADTLVPAVNSVKQAHSVLDRDGNFTEGLREFDEGCQRMEDVTSAENDRVREVYFESQARLKELFKNLQAAYARRDQLWKDLEYTLDETMNPTLDSLKTLPTDMERTIANLEKQSKQIAQKDNGGTEKVLKGLLSKFI